MKQEQLLSIVFSLIMFTGLSAGSAVAYAESDDDHDLDDRLEHFCEMTNSEKEKLFSDYPELAGYEDRLNEYCDLGEDEREEFIDDFIEEYFPNYEEHDDWDVDDMLDRYCEMSEDERAEFIANHTQNSEHQNQMDEYCLLDDSEKEAFIEEHEDEYAKHDYDIENFLEKYCEMTDNEKEDFIGKHNQTEDHKLKMDDYCLLDESEREDFLEEYEDVFIEEHEDDMKEKRSDHEDDMKEKRSDHEDDMKEKISEHKTRIILRASTLSDEEKDAIKSMHDELRDFKHLLRDKSISDSEKQEIRDQFMEMAKEFSMTWLSPRHQVAAGIDSEQVECRESFVLVMKTSNATPMCVKESTAEKLIERGIAISSI